MKMNFFSWFLGLDEKEEAQQLERERDVELSTKYGRDSDKVIKL